MDDLKVVMLDDLWAVTMAVSKELRMVLLRAGMLVPMKVGHLVVKTVVL